MLTTMIIKNLAVIRQLEINFSDGLIVLTGETGAGKSILVDALAAILGGRVSKEIIRKDEKSTSVEAAFYFSGEQPVPEALKPYLVDDSLIISREIFRDGRNVVKLNGSLSNTAELRSLAPYLISIHSQNDNQILFDSERHYLFLDSFAGNSDLFLEYRNVYALYKEVIQAIEELNHAQELDSQRRDYLQFVISEIEAANLQPDEEERLKAMKSAMKNKEKNLRQIQFASYALYEEENNAYQFVSAAESALRQLEGFEEITDRLTNLKYEISEINDKIRSMTDQFESEYENIDDLEERLNCIYQLKMKYGGSVEAVLEYYEKASSDLYQTEHRETARKELETKRLTYNTQLKGIAAKLSEKRRTAAQELAKRLEAELRDLMMPNARFEVLFTEENCFRTYGTEKVEFLFSANLGMPLQPLSKIASGGEVSRVNLALKSVLRGIDPACAFVFDEIDTGISGRAAQKTGEKMYTIASYAQVLCVTHLPQIAAMADQHILVEKEESDGETATAIRTVSGTERVSELARMIGGVSVTDLTLRNAEEILDMADRLKREH